MQGSTLQIEGNKEKAQHRNQTARRGWEDFSVQKALGSKRKILIWKWERNDATLPTSRSVKGLAAAFAYGRGFSEVPREEREGNVPHRMHLYFFHTPRVQDSYSFQNSYA